MSRRKPPQTSRITRATTVAYARKQKPDGAGTTDDGDGDGEDESTVAPAPALPEPVRARVETLAMPMEAHVGAPPEMPPAPAPAAAPVPAPVLAPTPAKPAMLESEAPTFMPGPREIPGGSPTDPARPPGAVPAGDSRSLRNNSDFALIYRQANAVITRFGAIGTRGQWRVVEYPTTAAASHAYAKECSRFVSEGFSDYRD
jgi:hypothetical protein